MKPHCSLCTHEERSDCEPASGQYRWCPIRSRGRPAADVRQLGCGRSSWLTQTRPNRPAAGPRCHPSRGMTTAFAWPTVGTSTAMDRPRERSGEAAAWPAGTV